MIIVRQVNYSIHISVIDDNQTYMGNYGDGNEFAIIDKYPYASYTYDDRLTSVILTIGNNRILLLLPNTNDIYIQ